MAIKDWDVAQSAAVRVKTCRLSLDQRDSDQIARIQGMILSMRVTIVRIERSAIVVIRAKRAHTDKRALSSFAI